jgi:hypothetical protein
MADRSVAEGCVGNVFWPRCEGRCVRHAAAEERVDERKMVRHGGALPTRAQLERDRRALGSRQEQAAIEMTHPDQ